MEKLTKRIAVTVSSVAVAGVAVLGAGGTASAATPASAHVERPAVGIKADGYRWDHGVGYLLEQGYSWDRIHGWHRNDCVTGSTRYGRDGHFHRWDDKECGWKSDWSYRHDRSRYEHDGRERHHHDRTHADR
ncbi:hypothetical protein [Streptomyces sp. NPDC047079]|uniref:hypothetical protein n=1 Tax=Streptomyces sp. NPDC047079 TaxID=3154607 RepID=UPI0033E874D2